MKRYLNKFHKIARSEFEYKKEIMILIPDFHSERLLMSKSFPQWEENATRDKFSCGTFEACNWRRDINNWNIRWRLLIARLDPELETIRVVYWIWVALLQLNYHQSPHRSQQIVTRAREYTGLSQISPTDTHRNRAGCIPNLAHGWKMQ